MSPHFLALASPSAVLAWMGLGIAGAAPFVAVDPLFRADPKGRHPGQWYLRTAGFPEAWKQGATGQGVVIGIVEKDFGVGHPQINPARVRELEWDFLEGDADPMGEKGELEADGWHHGTMVAGIAAARGGDGTGICGAAPRASLACIGLGAVFQLEAVIRHEPVHPGPIRIRNYSVGFTEPFENAREQGAVRLAFRETSGQGVLHVAGAGNEGDSGGGDCSKSIFCSNSWVIVVGACDARGRAQPWSGRGGSVAACAPSAAVAENRMITTTGGPWNPLPGFPGYTAAFGGTSASTPQVSGLMALAVERLPTLDSRLAKHLLVQTCARPTDRAVLRAGRNAAGVFHDERLGFGRIDAGKFVKAASAKPAPRVSPLLLEPATGREDELGMERVAVGVEVPDGSFSGMQRTFAVKGGQPLEEVEVFLELQHPDRGQLSAFLESPAGTRRELLSAHPSDQGRDLRWIFTCNAFWGEDPAGIWKLTITDSVPGEAGTLESFAWRMRMGRLVLPPAKRR